jgi:capsular exopolysaccharide synthesis family protein
MSRIHEALKKAEQERAGNPRAAEDAAEPGLGEALAPLPSLVEVGPQRTPEALPGELAFEELRERCRRVTWSLDPRTVLFEGKPQDVQHRPGTEEFRTLRSRLYQMRERTPLRTLLVSSALPAEGKTFVATNLAKAIVKQHERRALLVDADLRWSRLHLTMGAPQTPGLTDYLLGEADEFAIVQRAQYSNLFFVPGGKAVSNPAELIASGRMKGFLEKMAPMFDWVILDSPPAVPVADASVLADLCDGVLLVVRSAATPFDMAQKAVQEFREKHLIGVVLNDVEPKEGYSSYYYQYYYGSGRSNGKKKA